MKLTLGVAAAAIIIAFALPWIMPGWTLAGERHCGVRASWYGFESGTITASGESFNPHALTAAMPSRSHLGERWRVSIGKRSVTVRVNDYGPAKWTKRGIDLSQAAFAALAPLGQGTATVCLERIK